MCYPFCYLRQGNCCISVAEYSCHFARTVSIVKIVLSMRYSATELDSMLSVTLCEYLVYTIQLECALFACESGVADVNCLCS